MMFSYSLKQEYGLVKCCAQDLTRKFEVSKELWNMLLVKYMELKNFKGRMFIPVDTRKSSGRYRPYSNVDSFLKVCKVLGLSGVDLFSPSDVVEKKDTRKVCICIRSLSMKARSKQLKVPDFDVVTKTVAMPTDVVGCIRRSLELSTSSVTQGHIQNARSKSRQKSPLASHQQDGDEACLEESDEVKSNYSETSYADFLYLESGESQETANKYVLTQGLEQADTRNQETDKFLHTTGSAESCLLQYPNSDNELDEITSPVYESRLIVSNEFTPINQGAKFWHDNGKYTLSPLNIEEVDHRLYLSDMISFRIPTPVSFQMSEECLCVSCMGTKSHDSDTTPVASMCRIWRKFPDASLTSSGSSVVGRVLDFDFDAMFEPDNLRTLVSSTSDFQQRTELEISDSFSPCWDDAKSHCSVDQDIESLNHISSTQKDLADSLVLVKDNVPNFAEGIQKTVNNKLFQGSEMDDSKLNDKVDCICNDHVAAKLSERSDSFIEHGSGKGFGNVKKEGDPLCTDQSDDVHCYAEDTTKAASKDVRKEDDIDCLTEVNANGNNKKVVKTEKRATHFAPLLKTVAKGSALIGILFLLHFRNMRDRNANGKSTWKKSRQIHWKSSGVVFSGGTGENGSRIYPVEKLNFVD
ncbi:Calponin homology domain-containing protein [Artemisia annua]|uniref:Calponin homology domain-containing protein n=1 Tax=Artemisia annua TaxID=35608 RepID=A0A2U1PZL6_ARTAN|nr:Calponin homology domain-containing protein [Artemisia annua]